MAGSQVGRVVLAVGLLCAFASAKMVPESEANNSRRQKVEKLEAVRKADHIEEKTADVVHKLNGTEFLNGNSSEYIDYSDENKNGNSSADSRELRATIASKDPDIASPCGATMCALERQLFIGIDPIGNGTGYITRATGLPLKLKCSLLTGDKRHAHLATYWQFPNGTRLNSNELTIGQVAMSHQGNYSCHLVVDGNCCPGLQANNSVLLHVYEISDSAGIIIMICVLASIIILIGVFLYSQRKKRFHRWMKDEILSASSAESTPRSTLNRDISSNTKKYLLH